MVEGRLRLDTWEDKQTSQKRSRLGVVLESFQFLDSGRNREGGSPSDVSRSRPAPSPPPSGESGGDASPPEDDDVPF